MRSELTLNTAAIHLRNPIVNFHSTFVALRSNKRWTILWTFPINDMACWLSFCLPATEAHRYHWLVQRATGNGHRRQRQAGEIEKSQDTDIIKCFNCFLCVMIMERNAECCRRAGNQRRKPMANCKAQLACAVALIKHHITLHYILSCLHRL